MREVGMGESILWSQNNIAYYVFPGRSGATGGSMVRAFSGLAVVKAKQSHVSSSACLAAVSSAQCARAILFTARSPAPPSFASQLTLQRSDPDLCWRRDGRSTLHSDRAELCWQTSALSESGMSGCCTKRRPSLARLLRRCAEIATKERPSEDSNQIRPCLMMSYCLCADVDPYVVVGPRRQRVERSRCSRPLSLSRFACKKKMPILLCSYKSRLPERGLSSFSARSSREEKPSFHSPL